MWKDYLYLTKRERASVWALTVLVLLLQLGIWTSDLWLPVVARLIKPESNQQQPVKSFPIEEATANASASEVERTASPPVLRAFNPNTADSSVLRQLGLKANVVRNILKYRSKGGQFKKPDDLARIYGLDAAVFNRLRPYIRMSDTNSTKETSSYRSGEVGTSQLNTLAQKSTVESLSPALAIPSITASTEVLALPVEAPVAARQTVSSSLGSQFELNEADTATLQLLKGVGAITASRIVRYREQLGGYYDVRQLNEIKGLYPTVLETLTKTVSVNPDLITKININKASLEKLKAHPYLDFYKAKVIVELRKNRKSIRALSELSTFTEFTPSDLERLKWYVEL